MEYMIFGLAVLGLVVLVAVKGIYDDRVQKNKLIHRLRHGYGDEPQKEYTAERYASIARYFERHPQRGQLDDITWNDLNMDELFMRLNATESSSGEEILYHLLRSPVVDPKADSENDLSRLEELAGFFLEQPDDRVKLQLLLHKLGYTGRFSLYDYLDHLDVLGKRNNRKHRLLQLLYLPGIALCFVQPHIGVLYLVVLMLYGILSYFKEKGEIDPYITSFAYIMRLLETAAEVESLHISAIEKETARLKEHRKQLGSFKRGSFWLMSSGRMSGSSNPIDMLLDYGRMIFHLDLVKFNSMLEQVRRQVQDVDVLFSTLGYLDAAVAVGAFRMSLKEGYCVPVLHEDGESALHVTNCYHPLLTHPVKNSIEAKRGVLLTGSNASGKSTFLKTVAINAILAQSIHTVAADSYEGSYFTVCSSMALRDDLAGGESYYIVEIRAIKRLLDLVAAGEKLLCFVDEVLRGTNTVERIAASTEILKSMAGSGVLCFAATHDVELTELLSAYYDNYHFEEEIVDGDVHFPYKLLPGKTQTRNAIKLLSVMGYDERIIQSAELRAGAFMKTGHWENR